MISSDCKDESSGASALSRSSSLSSQRSVIVARPIFSQERFDRSHEFGEKGGPTNPWKKLKRSARHKVILFHQWHPSWCKLILGFIRAMFPILEWLPRYQFRQYIFKDLLSGFSVGIISIPAGMAYSMLAAMPPVFGLYTGFFPSILYVLMASSRHVSIGVFAVVSIMMGKVIHEYALPSTAIPLLSHDNFSVPGVTPSITSNIIDTDVNSFLESRIRVMVTLTVAVGMWQLLMGIFGLGYFTVYLSDQLVTGFTTGTAIHVFTSQLKSVLGLRGLKEYNGAFKLVYTYIDLFSAIKNTNIATLVISIISIIFLLLIKHLVNHNTWMQEKLPFRLQIPGDLFVVVFGALASYLMNLGPAYGVDTVGIIPLGMPKPRVPDFSIFPAFAMNSLAIAIVSFAITLSLSKMYSIKHKYYVDSNQQLRALGCSNIFGGFFQCVPSTVFLGRVAIQASIGGESQVVSMVSATLVLVVFLALGHLLGPLPKACLGSIILVAVLGLLAEVGSVRKLWKISAMDTAVFLVSLVSVVILDVDIGLAFAVGFSLLTIVFRTQRPDISVLGRAFHTDIYKRIEDYKLVAEVEGCKIISVSAPLYFANGDYFLERVRDLTKLDRPRPPQPYPSVLTKKKFELISDSVSPNKFDPRTSSISFPMEHPSESFCSTSSSLGVTKHDTPNREGVTDSVDEATWTSDYFEQPIKHVIVDCSSMCFVDINGVKAIKELAFQCRDAGMALFLTSCKADMKEMLALCGYSKELNTDHIFLTVHDAVLKAVQEQENEKNVSTAIRTKTPLNLRENSLATNIPGPPLDTNEHWSQNSSSFATQTLPQKRIRK